MEIMEVITLKDIRYRVILRAKTRPEKHGDAPPLSWQETDIRRIETIDGYHYLLELVPTAGSVAFRAYRNHRNAQTYDKKPIPLWHNLTADIRAAWELGALAAIQWVDDIRIANNLPSSKNYAT